MNFLRPSRLAWLGSRRCLLCDDLLSDAAHRCCPDCWQELPWRQQTLQLPQLQVHVACAYQWPMDRLIHLFKYQAELHWLPLLGAVLTQVPLPAAEVILPVPLSAQRLRERGYNQCQLLAQCLSQALDLPIWHGVQRIRHTERQQQLDAQQRQRNLRHAFAMTPDAGPLPASVLLLDDVLTTGSTLSELARLLRQQGVSEVHALVLASEHR